MRLHVRAALVLVVGVLIATLPFSDDLRRRASLLQQPFRIAQTWSLYGTGPKVLRRFEVWVDGDLRYRAGDPAHRWRRATFTYRRVRPTVVHSCMRNGRNLEPLLAWVVHLAREAHPDAQEVVVRCTVEPFPQGQARETLRVVAAAPDWVARQP